MRRVHMNKYWRQKQKEKKQKKRLLYSYVRPISKAIKVRRKDNQGTPGESRTE